MDDTDLLVIGGGPAGAAAAVCGARAGLSVTLHDRATFPRDKTCGDGLTIDALRRLERMGLDPEAVGVWQPVAEAVLHSPSGRRVALPLPTDGQFIAVTPRRSLDAAVLDLARQAGAKVAEGSAVTAVEHGDDSVVARFSDGAVTRARWVVAADGAYSPVRRLLTPGRAPELGRFHAFRQYFSGVADRRIHVLFDADLLPGYVWVFPLPSGRANVGFGILRHEGVPTRYLAGLWRDLLERPRLRAVLGDAVPEGRVAAWPIPAHLSPGNLAYGRVLFAGDAAAVTDPMTGEGIAQALATGEAATHAVATALQAHHGDAPHRVRSSYVAAVEAELGSDHRFARTLGKLLATSRGARGCVRVAGLSDWTRRNFARWLFEDYPRALILTPRRWHGGMFAGPGAYR
ncbi:MAG: geranylgeranyl reductase family protein [Actinobacteria bacterium]|nr:geranylgeranyl reductase family protein [Actinomycetota bacterium]